MQHACVSRYDSFSMYCTGKNEDLRTLYLQKLHIRFSVGLHLFIFKYSALTKVNA